MVAIQAAVVVGVEVEVEVEDLVAAVVVAAVDDVPMDSGDPFAQLAQWRFPQYLFVERGGG